jgi:NAD(P)-dependent dehydrogenase (short-subunit alcohol dehydrogenase family)
MISVAGKTVLVTGASRGIGRLIALAMAGRGCHLVLHSREPGHTATVAGEAGLFGVNVQQVAADLVLPEALVKMLDDLEAGGCEIDIVFNNAGFQAPYRQDVWDAAVDDFVTSFQVHCTAVAMICYRLLPGMLQRQFGRIVNVTSGIRNEPEQAAYSASKAALDRFTRDLGSRLDGTDVTMNLADPGWCRTDLGGPSAPNDPRSCLPGMLIGAFVNDRRSGRLFSAQDFSGVSLEEAVARVESRAPSGA